MVFDIEPVADVFALSVDRKTFAVTDIVDKQRDKLLRELIGTVVDGAIGHYRRHPVGVVEGSPNKALLPEEGRGCRAHWSLQR